jgi:CubicO group peptidase (beta-lactamase class C family)
MTPRELTSLVDRLGPRYLAEFQVPGMALGAILGQEVAVAAGYGAACLDLGVDVTPKTLFHMASVTKPFVATAVMQLVERGAVDLDDPFVKHVPHFKIADPRGETITVRQLLTHTSGLPDVESYDWDHPEFDAGALDRYIASLASTKLLAAPGERFSYSDIGFDILGALIAVSSACPFEDYVADSLLEPLGMRSSSLLLSRVDLALMACPHRLDDHGKPRKLTTFPYNRRHAGSSTLYSNINDMLRWAQANLNGGELDARRILQKASLARMWTGTVGNVHPAIPRGGTVGLSWFVFDRNGCRVVGHMGQDDGFASLLLLVPERQFAVVSMANRSHDQAQQGLWELQFRLLDRLAT